MHTNPLSPIAPLLALLIRASRVRRAEELAGLLDELAGAVSESLGFGAVEVDLGTALLDGDTIAREGEALRLPLKDSDGRLLGLLVLDEPAYRRPPSDEQLEAVAAHAALVLQAAQESVEAARCRSALELLLQASVRLAGARTPDAALDVLGEALATALGVDRAALEISGPDASAQAATGEPLEIDGGGRLLVPLHAPGGDVVGTIRVDVPSEASPPPRELLQAVSTFADQAGAVLAAAAELESARESETRKSTVLQSALDPVITIDADGRIAEFNPAAEETFGLTSAEAIGTDLAELIVMPDGDGPSFASYLVPGSRLIGRRTELTGLRSGGREFQLECALTCSEEHTSPLFTAYIRDITFAKRSENRLREMEAKYRKLVEGLPLVTYVTALDDPLVATYMSPQAERLLGYPVADWSSRDFYRSIVHPEDRERVLGEIFRAHQAGQPLSCEYRLIARDGRVVTVLDETVMVADDETGEPLFLQGYLLDVTERKRTTEALRQSEELYRLVVENSLDSISLIDMRGVVRYTSPSTAAMLGYPLEELIGIDMASLIHPDDLSSVQGQMRAALEGAGTPTSARLKHNDGRWRVLEGIASAVEEGPDGERVLLAVARDVTERTNLEEQLRQAQKMEAIGRLAGGVAHDFNNLLTAIGCYADFLVEGLKKDDPLRRDALEVKKAADRAAALTQQLLAFSRRQALQPRVLDLNEVVADVEDMLRRLIGEHVELALSLAPNLGRFEADRGQLEQVIVNLALNARDAMPDGGRMTIETGEVALGQEFTRLHPETEPGSYVTLAVSDTGTGLDAEIRAHLFEPFFTTKEQGKGTGLGLATVHGIVQQSGGTIDVHSEMGAGTTFTIYLPRIHAEAPVAEAPARAPAPSHGSETVLLVEDEDLVRVLARRILKADGYTVLEARDGSEALEVAGLHEGKIDLLVSDVVMPGLGGPELAASLAEARPGMAMLFMSGYTDQAGPGHETLQDGSAFIGKPFSPEAFSRKVREVLDAPRPTPGSVLLVEDQEPVREAVRRGLEQVGYTVLAAKDPSEAIRLAKQADLRIDLLLTDVFMPQMSGRTLAHKLCAIRPEMRLLYMSGQPDETLLEYGVVGTGSRFLPKPFTFEELQARVREVLEGSQAV